MSPLPPVFYSDVAGKIRESQARAGLVPLPSAQFLFALVTAGRVSCLLHLLQLQRWPLMESHCATSQDNARWGCTLMGRALPLWWVRGWQLWPHKMALMGSFSYGICDACRPPGHLSLHDPLVFSCFFPMFNFFHLRAQC